MKANKLRNFLAKLNIKSAEDHYDWKFTVPQSGTYVITFNGNLYVDGLGIASVQQISGGIAWVYQTIGSYTIKLKQAQTVTAHKIIKVFQF